jgi:hypothetical protein
MVFFPGNIKKSAIKTIDFMVAAHQNQPSLYIVHGVIYQPYRLKTPAIRPFPFREP